MQIHKVPDTPPLKGVAAAAGLVWTVIMGSYYLYAVLYAWEGYVGSFASVVIDSSMFLLLAMAVGLLGSGLVVGVSRITSLSDGWRTGLLWLVGSGLLWCAVIEWPPSSVAGVLRAFVGGLPNAWTVIGIPALLDTFARHHGAFTPAAMWRNRHLRSTVIAFLLIGFLAVAVLPVFDPAQRTFFHTRIR